MKNKKSNLKTKVKKTQVKEIKIVKDEKLKDTKKKKLEVKSSPVKKEIIIEENGITSPVKEEKINENLINEKPHSVSPARRNCQENNPKIFKFLSPSYLKMIPRAGKETPRSEALSGLLYMFN